MSDDFYKEHIIDHYKNPRNFGQLEKADYSWKEFNSLCGDLISIQINTKKEDGNERVSEVKFLGSGCAISMASASLLTEKIRDMTLNEVGKIGKDNVLKLLGIDLSPARLKCALLSLDALKHALVEGKNGETDNN